MKKMTIFEPALCCETGVCGVSIDSELLRISTILNSLKKHNVIVDRFNLNVAPMEFIRDCQVKCVNYFRLKPDIFVPWCQSVRQ